MSKTHTIITIGRQFGSGGREIGKRLADELEIEFYDKELLSRAAKDSKICKELFETHDEKPTNSFLYSLVMDTYSMGFASGSVNEMPLNHKIFLAQFDAIKKIAETRTVPDTTADVTWTKPSTVMPVSEKNLELFRHVQKAADMIGYGKLQTKKVGGWSDSCLAAAEGVPVVCAMGVKGANNHSMEEYAVAETLFSRAKLALASIIMF